MNFYETDKLLLIQSVLTDTDPQTPGPALTYIIRSKAYNSDPRFI